MLSLCLKMRAGRPRRSARSVRAKGRVAAWCLQGALPGAAYATLGGMTPFSAMATCTAKGAAVLAAEGEEDAICGESAAARGGAHARLAEAIAGALGTP